MNILFFYFKILGAIMKLLCSDSFAFDSKGLVLWVIGFFSFLIAGFSCIFFGPMNYGSNISS